MTDAKSAPQIGAQFGEIHNNGTGGGNVDQGGGMSNQTSNVPGQGYPTDYYSHHSNESSPTSPSMSGSEFNLQNSSMPTSNCECDQISEVQDSASTNATPSDTPADSTSSDSSEASSSDSSSAQKWWDRELLMWTFEVNKNVFNFPFAQRKLKYQIKFYSLSKEKDKLFFFFIEMRLYY